MLLLLLLLSSLSCPHHIISSSVFIDLAPFPMVINCLYLAVLTFALTSEAVASSDVNVVVYAGPRKCSNTGDGKPTKVEPEHIVGLHFTVTIDESSTGSRETLGKTIESSRTAGIAPSFTVGRGKVIEGLDRGLLGLCKGASAYIIVPPHLAYGLLGKPEQGVGSDATLRYDVEIVDIQPPVPNDFVKIDVNKDWKISKNEATEYFGKLSKPVSVEALWNDEDKDDDGYISWEEFTGPKGNEGPPTKRQPQRQQPQPRKEKPQPGQQSDVTAIFHSMDSDKDGKLSKAEMAAFFAIVGQDMPEEFWTESDPDGDGFVLFEEFVGSNKQAGKGEEL